MELSIDQYDEMIRNAPNHTMRKVIANSLCPIIGSRAFVFYDDNCQKLICSTGKSIVDNLKG